MYTTLQKEKRGPKIERRECIKRKFLSLLENYILNYKQNIVSYTVDGIYLLKT